MLLYHVIISIYQGELYTIAFVRRKPSWYVQCTMKEYHREADNIDVKPIPANI